MTAVFISFALIVAALLAIILTQKPDTTTVAQVAEASDACIQAIREAESTVGKFAPHNDECRRLLEKARYCLHFNKNSTMAIVTLGTLKAMRYNGVRYANQAAELALKSRNLP